MKTKPRDVDQNCTWEAGEGDLVTRTTCSAKGFHFLGGETPIQQGFGYCPYCGFRLKWVALEKNAAAA